MVFKRLNTGAAAGWRTPLLILLCVLTTSVPVQAQQERMNAGVESGAQLLTAATGSEGPDGNPVVHELSPNDAREDLSVFFTIGIVIDVLLLTGFLVWARGQWRRTRK